MKKQERIENKKRKTAALMNIIKINENDKVEKQSLQKDSHENFHKSELNEEPQQKRLKTDNMLLCNNAITDEQFKQLKKELSVRKNELSNAPKFRLKFFGEKASLSVTSSKRQPLMFEDIQYMLMLALLGSNSPFKPERWCVLEKANRITHSVILVIEGLTSYNFLANESLFIKTKGIFENQLEVVLPKYRKNKIIEELSAVPLTQAHKEMLIKKYGSLEAAMKLNKNPNTMFANSLFPIDAETDEEEVLNAHETFPRTRLLLSPLQMMIEGYPMPIKGELEERFKYFRFTNDHYKPVTSKSPLFGLDCEMVRTIKAENELARVSIVDENYQSIYETLVRPDNKIINYLTPWSGITEEMMQNVTKTLKEVQDEVRALLPPDAILVGQSLNCDLNAMKLMHPYCIDTSVIFNLTGDRNRKSKLQLLAKKFLDEEIQIEKTGHSSIEDSTACLKLTKLKLSKDIYFGDIALQTKKEVIERSVISSTGIVNSSEASNVKTPIFSHVMKRKKKSVIITTDRSEFNLSKFNRQNDFAMLHENLRDSASSEEAVGEIKYHKESNAKKVIKKTREVIVDHDFNLSHFNVFDDLLNDSDSEINPEMDEEEKITQVIPKIDKWIEKVWSSVASNGMFMVLFCGRDKNTNGVSMIQIKR